MKKLFGASSPEEARRLNAPVQNITSCNLSVDSGTQTHSNEPTCRFVNAPTKTKPVLVLVLTWHRFIGIRRL